MKLCPILLAIWPCHLDYPIARYNLHRFKNYFKSIYIGLSRHGMPDDLSNFIRANIPFANFVEVTTIGQDWRNEAINQILDKITDPDPICFIEQDFLIKDNKFFDKVFKDNHDFLYFKEGERVHPAFAVVKRELIEKTSRNFSAIPPGDHFYLFFNELPVGVDIETLGARKKEDYYHIGGLSQNYMCFQYGDPFYHPNNFLYYNYRSLQLNNGKHPKFEQTQQQIERTFGHPPHHAFLDNFFPS